MNTHQGLLNHPPITRYWRGDEVVGRKLHYSALGESDRYEIKQDAEIR